MRFNCALRNTKFLTTALGTLNGKVTNLVMEVHVPIMHNCVELRPQETLLLEVGPKAAKRPAAETWAHNPEKEAKAKKPQSATKGQPKDTEECI